MPVLWCTDFSCNLNYTVFRSEDMFASLPTYLASCLVMDLFSCLFCFFMNCAGHQTFLMSLKPCLVQWQLYLLKFFLLGILVMRDFSFYLFIYVFGSIAIFNIVLFKWFSVSDVVQKSWGKASLLGFFDFLAGPAFRYQRDAPLAFKQSWRSSLASGNMLMPSPMFSQMWKCRELLKDVLFVLSWKQKNTWK